jgi:hypothetical protein
MTLRDFLVPKWKHSDANVRLKAIEKIQDPVILEAVYRHDSSESVRFAAFKKLIRIDDTKISLYEVDLSPLLVYLERKELQKADLQTAFLLKGQVLGKKVTWREDGEEVDVEDISDGYLFQNITEDEMRLIPAALFTAIDEAWIKHTSGRFGFSAQLARWNAIEKEVTSDNPTEFLSLTQFGKNLTIFERLSKELGLPSWFSHIRASHFKHDQTEGSMPLYWLWGDRHCADLDYDRQMNPQLVPLLRIKLRKN